MGRKGKNYHQSTQTVIHDMYIYLFFKSSDITLCWQWPSWANGNFSLLLKDLGLKPFIVHLQAHTFLCNKGAFLSLFSCNFDNQISQNLRRFFILCNMLGQAHTKLEHLYLTFITKGDLCFYRQMDTIGNYSK